MKMADNGTLNKRLVRSANGSAAKRCNALYG